MLSFAILGVSLIGGILLVHKIISWILVLLPFIVAFVYVFLFGIDDEYLGNDM